MKIKLDVDLRPKLHGDYKPAKEKGYDDAPEHIRLSNSFKICALINLAWDYVDTILDIVSRQRISALKQLSRTIRTLRADFDSHMRMFLNSVSMSKELDRGLLLEDMVYDCMNLYRKATMQEIKVLDLTEGHQEIMQALYDAEVIIKSVYQLWNRMDKQIYTEYNIDLKGRNVIHNSFIKMSKLIKEFGGDQYRTLEYATSTANDIADIVFEFDMLNHVYKTEATWLFGEYQKRKEDICETECLDRLKKRFIRACAYKPDMIAHYNGNEVKIARVQIGKDGYEIYVYPKRKADGEWSKRPLKAVGGCESIDVIFNNELWN